MRTVDLLKELDPKLTDEKARAIDMVMGEFVSPVALSFLNVQTVSTMRQFAKRMKEEGFE